jgi:hypothetical protein
MASDKRVWFLLKVTGYGEIVRYGTATEVEDFRVAEQERTGKVTRTIGRADPGNRTHVERVEKELEVQAELRKNNASSYGDMELPELARPA